MFAMCGNANYEPDDNIILESTQIISQTDEDCLDLVIDEPSWLAQKHRKIGMIWSSTVDYNSGIRCTFFGLSDRGSGALWFPDLCR
ncbi:hypothetical protein AVEN_190102-1, partial [Araneus ventricosus]